MESQNNVTTAVCKTCGGARIIADYLPEMPKKPCPQCCPLDAVAAAGASPAVIAAIDAALDAVTPPLGDVDRVLEWLMRAPDDWPFTGRDIAMLIKAGMPEWEAGR